MTLNKAQKLSIWAICCVSVGLLFAAMDGVSTEAILETALIATGIGLTISAFALIWSKQSKQSKDK